LGDTLQFIRYAPLVKERGGTVLVECPPKLHALLGRCRGIDQLVPPGPDLPPFDVQAALLDLPAIFRTTLATMPAEVPYLFPDPDLVTRWQGELEGAGDFRIGLNWRGSPRNPIEQYRSLHLAQFAPLARVPGVRLISLQKGTGTEQIREVAGQF